MQRLQTVSPKCAAAGNAVMVVIQIKTTVNRMCAKSTVEDNVSEPAARRGVSILSPPSLAAAPSVNLGRSASDSLDSSCLPHRFSLVEKE